MKVYYMVKPALLILWLAASACSNNKTSSEGDNSTPRIKKETRLVSPKINQKFTWGENIPFSVTSDHKIDSVIVEIDGRDSTFFSGDLQWVNYGQKTGSQKARVTVYFDGKSENHYPRFKVLSDVKPKEYSYRVIKEYPHNTDSYVQGLFFKEDTLYESTGTRGKSSFSKVNLNTGKAYQSVLLDAQYFGEGSTYWEDKLIVITWTKGTGLVFNENLKQTGTFSYTSEGWGLTTYGDLLIMSDGTETLHFLDPRDFSEVDKLEVYDDRGPVDSLNELEIIDGLLYANVYPKDIIVVIDPKTGKVLRSIQMGGLIPSSERNGTENALNGIAYNPLNKKTYVTGKLWPKLFEVEFIPLNQ